MTPLTLYKQKSAAAGYQYDSCQMSAMAILEDLFTALLHYKPGRRFIKSTPPQGAYLWGDVGRGKTYLMDLFYEALPFTAKWRLHFYHFMALIHQTLKQYQGKKDPLKQVAIELSDHYKIICLDEFMVQDVADAMILGTLFEYLFQAGVVLVTTSNTPPDLLYNNGLNRERFLPTIALIKAHLKVIALSGDQDYRLKQASVLERYHLGLDNDQAFMEAHFEQLNHAEAPLPSDFELCGRIIHAQKRSASVIWFDFQTLCYAPRGQADYIALSQNYQTILLSAVPQMTEADDNEAQRFIGLVDELYDNGILFILSASHPISELYAGTRLAFAFERTKSRLIEMQSSDYPATHHPQSSPIHY